jgi:hypothetical protein
MSMTAQGVPYSRAILVASGVVMGRQLQFSILVIASEAKQSIYRLAASWIASSLPSSQ